MHTVEFKTTITDSFVQIPNYKEFENKQVKIIILDISTDMNSKKVSKIDALFDKFQVDMKNFTFDRDEANAR